MTMTGLFMQALENYYGPYESGEVRRDVEDFVGRTFEMTGENLDLLIKAIKYSTQQRFGAPDLATIRLAVRTWESEGNQKIKKLSLMETYHAPRADSEEIQAANAKFRARAASMGINPDRDPAWFWKMMSRDLEAVRRGEFQQIRWADYDGRTA